MAITGTFRRLRRSVAVLLLLVGATGAASVAEGAACPRSVQVHASLMPTAPALDLAASGSVPAPGVPPGAAPALSPCGAPGLAGMPPAYRAVLPEATSPTPDLFGKPIGDAWLPPPFHPPRPS